jgi:hypothetical protein
MGRTTYKPEVLVSNFIRHIDYFDWLSLFFLSYWRKFQGQSRFVWQHSFCHCQNTVRASEIGVKQTWDICSPPLHTNPRQFHPPLILKMYIPTIHINNEVQTHSGPKQLRYSDSLRAGRSGDRSSVWARFSTPIHTGPGAHPASYITGTESFPGVKWPGCGVDHPPPF